jgi:hypothetical protein
MEMDSKWSVNMNKKLVVFVGALVMAGSACATSTQAQLSPFTDNLTIKFQGFPSENLFSVSYFNNNGVNIVGPAFINPDGDALVTVSSNNKLQSGTPGMILRYPTMSGSTQDCMLTFIDGPLVPALTYKAGVAPVCPGIVVSNISETGKGAYQLTITDSEP